MLALVSAMVALFGLRATRDVRFSVAAAILLVMAVIFPDNQRLWLRLHGDPLSTDSFVEEDAVSVTALTPQPGGYGLAVNGRYNSWLPYGWLHTIIGTLPALAHPAPLEVAVIGLGSGDTAWAAGCRPETRSVTVFEIASSQPRLLARVADQPLTGAHRHRPGHLAGAPSERAQRPVPGADADSRDRRLPRKGERRTRPAADGGGEPRPGAEGRVLPTAGRDLSAGRRPARGAGIVTRAAVSRRHALGLIGAGLGSPLLARVSAAPAADAWPQFRGDPRLTGVAAGVVPSLTVAWTFEAASAVESSAAVAAGTVFVGTGSGELLALDLQTGARRWAYATGSEIAESSPCVAGGLVYVGDIAGVVHAVSARDGRRTWVFRAKSQVKASPVVAEGKVLIGSYDQHVYALDAASGKLAWSLATDGQVHSTAAVADSVAYVTGCDAAFRALRVADGKELFQVSSGAYTGASPAILDGRAFYGTFENEVLAVDLAGRRVLWRYRHAERQFPFYSSAAVSAGTVVLGGRDKMIHALDAATGKARWTFATGGRVDASPLVAGGQVCVGSGDGRLYVLDLAKGTKLAEFDTGSPMSASPALAAGRLVVGTQDGQVFCFGPRG